MPRQTSGLYLTAASVFGICLAPATLRAASREQAITLDAFRRLSEKELSEVSRAQLSHLPAWEFVKRMGRVNESFFLAMAGDLLIDLRYIPGVPTTGSSSELVEGLKRFQADLGHPATGVLTVAEWEELMKRGASQHETPVRVSAGLSGTNVSVYVNFASAHGTWEFADREHIRPNHLSISKIRCWRHILQCFEAIANLDYGADQSDLEVDLRVWDISKWTDEDIIAHDYSASCVSATLMLSGSARSGSIVRRSTDAAECESVTKESVQLTLVNGFDASFELGRQRAQARTEGRSSRYQETIRTLAAAAGSDQ